MKKFRINTLTIPSLPRANILKLRGKRPSGPMFQTPPPPPTAINWDIVLTSAVVDDYRARREPPVVEVIVYSSANFGTRFMSAEALEEAGVELLVDIDGTPVEFDFCRGEDITDESGEPIEFDLPQDYWDSMKPAFSVVPQSAPHRLQIHPPSTAATTTDTLLSSDIRTRAVLTLRTLDTQEILARKSIQIKRI